MVAINKPPSHRSAKVKTKAVYANKASCFVLAPVDRMNLAQFCALLMTIDKQTKKESDRYDKPTQKSAINIIRLRKLKNSYAGPEGSQTRGPLFFKNCNFSFVKISYFHIPINQTLTHPHTTHYFVISFVWLCHKKHDRHHSSFNPAPTFQNHQA
jgi:hypothetical protein